MIYLHAYFTPPVGTPRWELLVLQLSHFVAQSGVPVFLFMSGFLFARHHSPDFGTFTRHRLRRRVLPVAVWMTAALAFEAWRAGGLSRDLLLAFARFDIEGQFFYLSVLLVLTFAAYPLRRWSYRQLGWLTAAAFVANLATVAWYSMQTIAGLFATLASRNPLMWRSPSPSASGSTARAGTSSSARASPAPPSRGWRLSRRTTSCASCGSATIRLILRHDDVPLRRARFVVYPGGLRARAGCAPWRAIEAHALLAPFRALAPYAFAGYLVHQPYFLGYLSHRLVATGPFAHDYLTLMLAHFVVGGGLAIAAVVVLDRIAPRFAALFLGVEHPHAAPPPLERRRAA